MKILMGFFDWLIGSKMKAETEPNAISEISGRANRQSIESVRKTEAIEAEVDIACEFIFTAVNQDSKELSQCKLGEFVKFWYDSKLECIRIYRRGTVGGSGQIGDVPLEYYDIILNHLQQNLEVKTELLDKKIGKIKYRLVPKAETDANWSKLVNANANRLSTEVKKKYSRKPKDGFEIRVTLLKTHTLNNGDILYIEKRPIDYYIRNAKPFNINLVNEKGEIVGSYGSYFDLCVRMLRAFYNGYKVIIKLTSVKKPDIYEMKYIESVYAMAVVIFESVEQSEFERRT